MPRPPATLQDPAPLPTDAAAHDAPGLVAELVASSLPPDSWLRRSSFLIENWKWLGLLLLVALGVLLERVVAAVLRRAARRVSAIGRVPVDEAQLGRFVRPFGVMVTVWVFASLLPVLAIGAERAQVERALDVLASAVLTVAAIVAAWRFVDLVCDFLRAKARLSLNKFDDMLVPLLRRTLKVFVFVIGLAFVASKLTEDVWKIVAGLSVGGAILALAFKDSVENVFGTFTVLLDKPFQLGDWITVGGVDGTVEKVGFRSTRVRTFYDSLISVPNRTFITATIDNWGARRYRRIRETLGLTYDTPPEKVEAFCEGVREVIRLHPYTRKDHYHVYLNGFGDSSLNVLLYCFVETPDWSMELREKHRLFADVLRLAERLGVSFAFPSRSVYMVDPADLEHADRPPSDPEGADRGREEGRAVAEETLRPYGGERPGPVRFS